MKEVVVLVMGGEGEMVRRLGKKRSGSGRKEKMGVKKREEAKVKVDMVTINTPLIIAMVKRREVIVIRMKRRMQRKIK